MVSTSFHVVLYPKKVSTVSYSIDIPNSCKTKVLDRQTKRFVQVCGIVSTLENKHVDDLLTL
jgi:NMD protein affecting ribosome stability and mRNA decay